MDTFSFYSLKSYWPQATLSSCLPIQAMVKYRHLTVALGLILEQGKFSEDRFMDALCVAFTVPKHGHIL